LCPVVRRRSGSRANAEPGPRYLDTPEGRGSDLDILVEMETDLPPSQRRLLARRTLGRTPCPVDVLVYTPGEIAARRESLGSIIPEILREGIEVG
jgi:hypothetical protein